MCRALYIDVQRMPATICEICVGTVQQRLDAHTARVTICMAYMWVVIVVVVVVVAMSIAMVVREVVMMVMPVMGCELSMSA